MGRFIAPEYRNLSELLLIILSVGLVVFAMGLLGGYLLSAKSVKPIEQIAKVAGEISEQDLSKRIDDNGMAIELSQLSSTLNHTFDRLEAAFSRQKQFTADASHELRTPLSVLQVHQQLALSKPRSPEEYRQAFEVCQRVTGQMNQLVQSLLMLARTDAVNSRDGFESVDLTALVGGVVEQMEPFATDKKMVLKSELQDAIVDGNDEQLNQVVTNLISNAIAHCPDETEINVRLLRQEKKVVLQVQDNGPGIPQVDQPRIFDRFYQVSESRARDSGGSGLGLSICQAIVKSHDGEISVRSKHGEGCEFEVRLPMLGDWKMASSRS